MKNLRRPALIAGLVLAVAIAVALAQRPSTPAGASEQLAKGPPLQPQVAEMLRDISSERIERSIRTLAGFGTRHTLSS
jgi:uncharacterized membrane protein